MLTVTREYKVSLDWGDVAIKEWGDVNGTPVLALHGWQDNAGSFDTLVPLLPKHLRVVCAELAGHGLSSHYPAGMMYNFWDYVLHMHMLVKHLQWESFSVMGHSLGGIIGLVFAALYPERVDRVVMLDMVKPVTWPAQLQPLFMGGFINRYHELFSEANREDVPSYSYSGARERVIKGSRDASALDEQSAEVLMKRGIKEDGKGGFVFSRDFRHSILSTAIMTLEQQRELFQRLQCSLLIIKGKDGPYYDPRESYLDFIEEGYKNCKSVKYVEVDGKHHVHLTNPERVAPYIVDLFQLPSKL